MSSQQRSLADPRQDEYRILHEADLRDYLAGLPAVAARLGGAPASWSISEVGDGNLNLVFIVKGDAGGIAVKQALPYVRLVGESWPLPLSRSHYEYLALTHQARLAPGLVPDVLHHNEGLALVVMELIEPHIIMRKGLVAGTLYPRFVGDIATFLARTLFFSSDLALPAAKKKEGIAAFAGNHALCKITEDLIFTDPYRVAEQNRWTQPWLDATAAAFREDLDLHVAISRLKLKFMAAPEALIHGDLHTGSIMVTERLDRGDRSRIRFLRTDGVRSRRGHRQSPDELSGLRRPRTLAGRTAAVRGLGAGNDRKRLDGVRPRVPRALADGSSRRRLSRDAVSRALPVRRVWRPNGRPIWRGCSATPSGFSAAKIIRRILGLAHNIDFELIEDPKQRAICEARSLRLARAMMVETASFRTHRRRDEGGAGGSRLAAGFRLTTTRRGWLL